MALRELVVTPQTSEQSTEVDLDGINCDRSVRRTIAGLTASAISRSTVAGCEFS